jgi:hypothetical protein
MYENLIILIVNVIGAYPSGPRTNQGSSEHEKYLKRT